MVKVASYSLFNFLSKKRKKKPGWRWMKWRVEKELKAKIVLKGKVLDKKREREEIGLMIGWEATLQSWITSNKSRERDKDWMKVKGAERVTGQQSSSSIIILLFLVYMLLNKRSEKNLEKLRWANFYLYLWRNINTVSSFNVTRNQYIKVMLLSLTSLNWFSLGVNQSGV